MADSYTDLPDVNEVTPEKLVDIIFSDYPKDPCSLKIIPYTDKQETDMTSYIFELLINVYIDAVIDSARLYEILKTKSFIDREPVEKINVYEIKKEHLELPEPWFKSFGFYINVSEYTTEQFSDIKDDLNHIYCKVILKDNPSDYGYFFMRGITKLFQFVKLANYKETNKLEDVSMLFIRPKDKNGTSEKYFLISFKQMS